MLQMHMDDLRWFITLAELERMTAAADRLHIAQPTLSRMLARLERELGAQLFDRHGKRIELNAAGRLYYDRARRAQSELDAAARDIADLTSPSVGTVRLAFQHSFGLWLVPQLIRAFRAQEPRVTFTLAQGATNVIAGWVAAGETDVAIVSPRPVAPDLGWRLLRRQRLALAVPADHPFAVRPDIDLRAAMNEPFIAMQPEFGMRRILEELCATAHFRPNIAFETSELATIAGLVAAGLGVSVLPMDDNPQYPPELVHIPLTGTDASREIGLVWNVDRRLARPARAFAQFVEGAPGTAGGAAGASG